MQKNFLIQIRWETKIMYRFQFLQYFNISDLDKSKRVVNANDNVISHFLGKLADSILQTWKSKTREYFLCSRKRFNLHIRFCPELFIVKNLIEFEKSAIRNVYFRSLCNRFHLS